jgi:hypothetical protein
MAAAGQAVPRLAAPSNVRRCYRRRRMKLGQRGNGRWIAAKVRSILEHDLSMRDAAKMAEAAGSRRQTPDRALRRKDFLPVEPQGGLSFLFRLSAPRFA